MDLNLKHEASPNRITSPSDLILAIETSCDETSAAVVRAGREVLSNVVASQLIHASYGGVVPELASREHLRAIVPVVREAMNQAGVTYPDLAAIAVTEGPGLAGALLVGITFAKAAAFAAGRPLIAVNHLEGHIHAVLMESAATIGNADPLLALVVSGGHTHLYLAHRADAGTWHYRNVGKTLDDAAGEAYDKAAKLLGLPYPGGPWMDALAPYGNPAAVPFTMTQLKNKARFAPKLRHTSKPQPPPGTADPQNSTADPAHPETAPEPRFDFSFSGIKTAVRRYTEFHAMRDSVAAREATLRTTGLHTARPGDPEAFTRVLACFDAPSLDLIASFQSAVTAYLVHRTFQAAEHFGAQAILVSGGVSANRLLRERMTTAAARRNLPIAFPRIALATDNAAMIAAAAWPKLLASHFAPDTLEPTPQLRLG